MCEEVHIDIEGFKRTEWKHTGRTVMSDRSGAIYDEGLMECELVPQGEGTLISSRLTNEQHSPAIDIDLPCQLVESSPGKFHLYVDKAMPWNTYIRLLKEMSYAGLVEPGFVSCAAERNQTILFKPGAKQRMLDARARSYNSMTESFEGEAA